TLCYRNAQHCPTSTLFPYTTLFRSILDDEAEAQPAISAYNKLMDEGVDVILGNVTSGSTIAITELTKEDGILQITPSGSALDCRSEEHTSELQSREKLVCRLLLEKK